MGEACKNHPQLSAQYHCEGCGELLCGNCIEESHVLLLCRICGERAWPLREDQPATVQGLEKLRQYCAEYGRDPESLAIIARPGDNYEINAETQARHVELGVNHLVVDTPIKEVDPDLKLLRAQMERVAEVCGLTARS